MRAENLLWSGTPSQVTNFGAFVIWGLLACTLVLAPVAFFVILWKYLAVKNQVYELTNQRLKMHSGVLSKRIEELELYRVRDTQFEQPFFLRLFGLGNVILLTTDTTSPEVIVPAIPNAQAIREQIRYAVEETRDSKRVRVAELE